MNREEKNSAFEKWYQEYISSHDVGNPAKYKEFARWAFWGGIEAAQRRVHPTAFGVGTQAQFPLLGSSQADESSATNGGG